MIIKKIAFVFFVFFISPAISSEGETRNQIYNLLKSYENRNCEEYRGEFNITGYEDCQEIYVKFTQSIGLSTIGWSKPQKAELLKYLWYSDSPVLTNNELFRMRVLSSIARQPIELREYITDEEIEKLAFKYLYKAPARVRGSAISILGALGKRSYLNELTFIAIDSRELDGFEALSSIDDIIADRNELRSILWKIRNETKDKRFVKTIDRYISGSGGWAEFEKELE